MGPRSSYAGFFLGFVEEQPLSTGYLLLISRAVPTPEYHFRPSVLLFSEYLDLQSGVIGFGMKQAGINKTN